MRVSRFRDEQIVRLRRSSSSSSARLQAGTTALEPPARPTHTWLSHDSGRKKAGTGHCGPVREPGLLTVDV